MTTANVFNNPSGQRTNLGDSILRRGLIESIRPHAHLNILVNGEEQYTSGLGLSQADTTFTSKARWLTSAAFSRDSVFVINAGEHVAANKGVFRWQTALSSITRAKSGRVFASGVGLRDPASANVPWVRSLFGSCDVLEWRDPESRDAFGRGDVIPDWAFSLGSIVPLEHDRPFLTLTMRGDRPFPSENWLRSVRDFAREEGLDIKVIVQVRADTQRSAELAEALAGEFLPWESDATHEKHEKLLRAIYARSTATISDRIHALIVGLTEGSVPIGLCVGPPEKVRRTFSAVTSEKVALQSSDKGVGDLVAWMRSLLNNRSRLLADLFSARARLKDSQMLTALVAESNEAGAT